MRRIRKMVLTFCFVLTGLFLMVPAEAAEQNPAADPLARKTIAFVVYDHTGEATPSMKEVWKRQVRQAYPRAKFAFLPDAQAAEGANEVLTQFGGDGYPIEKEVMDKIADKTGATVVSLLVVRDMEEYYIQPMFLGGWDDDGPDMLLRVISGADMYIYRKDTGKYMKKKLRKIETTDVALAVHPEKEIQYALSNLAMTMEGKDLI
jgi:ribosomal protein S24E